MAHRKSEIVDDVYRSHYGHCFYYVAKTGKGSSTCIPTVAAAQDTPFERITCIVRDVSIDINKFGMGDYQPTGRNLVDFLLADVKRAFLHPRIHTYVLAADMSCFGVEAKQPLQEQRVEEAKKRAIRDKIVPFKWNIDDPEQIVDLNRGLPSLYSMQASPGVIRQVLFEAMTLISVTYRPPKGKRLILHMEPRFYTNPALPADFMPQDPTTGIVLCRDRLDVIEAARATMDELWQAVEAGEMTRQQWRRVAREKTTMLAKAGCFFTVPLVLETSVSGVSYAPFRAMRMRFQSGEADLTIQRYVTYLYTGEIFERLAGERKVVGLTDDNDKWYTADQVESTRQSYLDPPGAFNIEIGYGGRKAVQCCGVISVDSDFFGLLTYTIATLVAKQDMRRQTDKDPSGFDVIGPHTPLLIRGEVLTRTRATLQRGERRQYYSESAKQVPGMQLVLSHEIFDPGLFYAELTQQYTLGRSPLEVIREDADLRGKRTLEKLAATRERKKRALSSGEELPDSKKSSRGSSASSTATPPCDEDEIVGDDSIPPPIIHLPSPPANANADEMFEWVASFIMFTCMLGNDYLAGLQGVPRRWAYAAYAEMLHKNRQALLVRVVRVPGENDISPKNTRLAAPDLPLIIHAGVHERVMGYCYYMNLMAQPYEKNKPTTSIDAMTFADVEVAVARKFPSAKKQPPDGITRERMLMRLQWVLKYFTHGTTSIRGIIDSLEFGWEGEWIHIIV